MPLRYIAFAHLCLATAFAIVALRPDAIAGFFYHPRALALVHLVTLGWLTCSILGYLYIVAPMALRVRLPTGRIDNWVQALIFLGTVGMVSHFWIDEYAGIAWTAATLVAAVLLAAVRIVPTLAAAPVPIPIRVHLVLAFVNLAGAGTLGTLVALERQMIHVLPGHVLSSVFAHAHWAALGWVTMIIMGVGYRLLPMLLPSAVPARAPAWASAVLLEVGAIGLVVSLLVGNGAYALASSALVLGAIVVFGATIARMTRRPRPSPPTLPRPDVGIMHVFMAIAYLGITAVVGIGILLIDPSETEIRIVMVYGVLGLVGFLAQMVFGVAARVLPTVAWMQGWVRSGFAAAPPTQYAMSLRGLQAAGFVAWLVGVPLLATGLFFDARAVISAGGAVLLAGALAGSVNAARAARHAVGGAGSGDGPR